MICRPKFAALPAVFITSIVLMLTSPFAVAHDFKVGDIVIILSNTHLEGKTSSDPCGDAVWRGRPATILSVDGERLLLGGERSGWLESHHVMHADPAAIDRLNVWLTSEPSNAALYAARAVVWQVCDEFEAAIADIDLSIELQPDNAYWYYIRGCFYEENGKANKALKGYQRVVELQPKFRRALDRMALIMVSQFKLDAAKNICDDVIADFPSDETAYLIRAVIWDAKSFPGMAAVDAQEGVRRAPDRPTPYEVQASLHVSRGALREALQFFTLGIEQHADQSESYYVRGRVLFKMGEFERALSDIQKALSIRPKSVKYLKGRADIHLAMGKYDAASADLKMALLRDALSELPFDLQRGEKQFPASADKTMEQLGNWLESNPGHEVLRFQRAAWFIRHESYDEALLDLDRVIEAGVGREHAYIARGIVRGRLKQFVPAEQDFEAALKFDQDNVTAIRERSMLYASAGELEGAIQGFNLAMKLDPENAILVGYRANAYFELQEYEESLKDVELVLKSNSDNLSALILRAVIWTILEEYAKAKLACDAVLLREADNENAHFFRAYCNYQLGALEESLVDLEAILLGSPKDFNANLLCIEVRFLLKKYDQIIVCCNSAIEVAPKNAMLYLTRGLILHHFGNTASAREDFEAAIKLGLPGELSALAKDRLTDPAITDLPEYSPVQPLLLAMYKQFRKTKRVVHVTTRVIEAGATKDRGPIFGKGEKAFTTEEPTLESKIANAKELVEQNPDRTELRLTLAKLLMLAKHYNFEAMHECDEVLKRDPTVAMAYVIRAKLYAYRAEYAKANADAQRAFELDPSPGLIKYERRATVYDESVKATEAAPQPKNEEELLLTLGDEQLASQHYAVAINLYNKAITANPQGARQYYNRGLAYAAMQAWEEASADMQKSIELAPENVELLSGTAWFFATANEAKWRNVDLAVKFATKAHELSEGKEGRCLGTLAAAFAAAGNYAEAVKYQKQAQSLYNEEEQAAYGYLIALYESKRPYQAQP